MKILRLAACAPAVLAIALSAAGCSVSYHPAYIPKAQLDKEVMARLTAIGAPPDSVTCPDDLTAKVGASTRCTLSASGTSYGLTVTVKSVVSSNADINIKVDTHPVGG